MIISFIKQVYRATGPLAGAGFLANLSHTRFLKTTLGTDFISSPFTPKPNCFYFDGDPYINSLRQCLISNIRDELP